MSRTIRRIGVLTGGGDCPGINAVIRAITKSAIYKYGLRVIGIEDGFLGLVENSIAELTTLHVAGILTRGERSSAPTTGATRAATTRAGTTRASLSSSMSPTGASDTSTRTSSMP